MSISALNKQSTHPADILTDANNLRILKALESYSKFAMDRGFHHAIYSKASIQQLANIPANKKFQIAESLELCLEWAASTDKLSADEKEKATFLKALNHYGLSVDQRLLDTIDRETVVEIYNEDMIQLYRSFNMLEMTGYSLLDLCVYEWWVLWERPKLAVQKMHEEGTLILQSEIPFKDLNVPRHVLKETLNSGITEPFVPRNCMVEFQHIGFLQPQRIDAPRALVCTAKGFVIAEGLKETSQIAFL